MESAIFGLIGVVLGSLLSLAREWWFQRRQEKKDAEFLVILVSRQLDLYTSKCVEIVADEGERDIEGHRYPKTSASKFEPELVEVEWKSLPVGLMQEIFDLPFRAEQAEKNLSDISEYVAQYPDYDEWYEERQYQYAVRGIEAHTLANRLRAHVGLFQRQNTGNWDPISFMQGEKSRIEKLRIERRASAPG